MIIVYLEEEFEHIEKTIEELEAIDFGDLRFQVVTVDASFDNPSASNI